MSPQVAGLSFERVELADVPWEQLDRMPDRWVFQTRPWLEFLEESLHVEPVVARVVDRGAPVGWFTAAILRRFGVRVLGSPLRGWTTAYMGFNLHDGERRADALAALPRFGYDQLGCVHLEMMDRNVDMAWLTNLDGRYRSSTLPGYELHIARSDDELLAAMTKNGRRDVRRALRNGITVEEVDPFADRSFVDEYYEQVTEAFAKRDLVPTYPVDRVRSMVRHVHPSGQLLLLRARDPHGNPAATGLFPGLPGGAAFFWMGASDRDKQALLPNEALMWHALRAWRDRGAVRFDFGGGGSYKEKYGGQPHGVPWLRHSRFALVEVARNSVKRGARWAQVRAGRRRTRVRGTA